jgi:hypothetical protein
LTPSVRNAVIDKDLASAVLAVDLHADALLIVIDVDAGYEDWGTPQQVAIARATPAELAATQSAEGSMGPKVKAACQFVEQTGGFAAIGSIDDAPAPFTGAAGTRVVSSNAVELPRSVPRQMSTRRRDSTARIIGRLRSCRGFHPVTRSLHRRVAPRRSSG